jgi:hypothetical protein
MQEEITSRSKLNDEPDEETGNAPVLGTSSDSLSDDPITTQTAPISFAPSSPPTDEAEPVTTTASVESKDTGKEKRAQGRAVSFDPSSDSPSPRIVEDLSESESSFQAGTLTARQYRRRRAMQLGALALLLVILPLAIGLGVAYSNRPSSSSTSKDSAVPDSSSNPTIGPMIPTVAPSAALVATPAPTVAPAPRTTTAPASSTDPPATPSPTMPPTEIVFAPVTSILDLLVANNATRRDL